jgi:hypothetical protein
MAQPTRQQRLISWTVGAAVVLAAVIYTGYQMFIADPVAPVFVRVLVLIAIPAIYLALMYVTLAGED